MHAGSRRHGEKLRVHQVAPRQPVRHIAQTHRHRQAELFAIEPDRLQDIDRRVRIGRQCGRQGIQHQVFFPKADGGCGSNNPAHRFHPFAGIGRQTAGSKRQTQHRRAVFLGDRQKLFQPLRLRRYGIDQRPAGIYAQSGLQRVGVGGIDCQRQSDQLRQFVHQPHHQRRLVDAGNAGVHVENRRACRLLGQRIMLHRRQVALAQLGGHQFAASRIDPFADDPDGKSIAEIYGRRAAGQAVRLAQRRFDRHRAQAGQRGLGGGDMGRSGAAATANRRHPGVNDFRDPAGELLRTERERRPPVRLQHRHAGVRSQSDRQRGGRHHFGDHRQ